MRSVPRLGRQNPGVSVCRCVWSRVTHVEAGHRPECTNTGAVRARARVSACQSAVYSSQILQVMPLVFRVKLS